MCVTNTHQVRMARSYWNWFMCVRVCERASVCVSLFIFCIRTDTHSTSTYMLPQIHIETLRKYAAFNKNGNMHSNSRHKTNEYVKVVATVVMVMGWEWEWEWKKAWVWVWMPIHMWMWCSCDAKWSKIRLWIMFVDIVYHETTKCQYLYLDH